MTERTSQIAPTSRTTSGWSVGAAVIAAVVLLPIVAVIWMALHPTQDIWRHLVSTTLPRYLGNSILLMAMVGVVTGVVGTTAAWMVVMYRFPASRWLEWALLFPLAVPAYVGAYALVDFLEYAGPVQTGLRALAGWESARDYAFPEVRSRGGAVIVISAALYPYVYLLARAAFRELSAQSFEVARALGAGHGSRFLRVGLPLARPAIAAGMAVVMMETINDFGVVDYFGVQTLTTGIFTVWLEQGNPGGAAQIACVILMLVLVLVTLEKISRRRSRFYAMTRSERRPTRTRIRGLAGAAATTFCAIPFALGFGLPVSILFGHAANEADRWLDPGLVQAALHSFTTGGAAAALTVGAAVFLVYGVRLSGRGLPRLLMPATMIGYAAPGAVLGIGLLLPLAWFDNRVADLIVSLGAPDPGLLLTGSAAAIVLAYFVRFFAIGQGATDAAMGRVSPSLPMAARALGRTAGGTLGAVYLPLMRGSLATALLLVFVDAVKELPATLLLRPFNYDTLATRVYEQASLERIGDAAPAALLVTAAGVIAVAALARANR